MLTTALMVVLIGLTVAVTLGLVDLEFQWPTRREWDLMISYCAVGFLAAYKLFHG